METSVLLKRIELETGQHICNVTTIHGGNQVRKEHLMVSLTNERKILIKKIRMSRNDLQRFESITSLNIVGFQQVLSIIPDGNDDYYIVTEWIDGILLGDIDNGLTNSEKLKWLYRAAEKLRMIHATTKTQQISNITLNQINSINTKPYLLPDEKRIIIEYVSKHLQLLNKRHHSIIHGDFHLNNVLVAEDRTVFLDLDDIGYGDPYMDLVYAANLQYQRQEQSSYYLFLHYYFNNNIPDEFWPIVNVYSLAKAMRIIEEEIRNSETHKPILSMSSVLKEHKNMTQQIPSWFLNIQRRC